MPGSGRTQDPPQASPSTNVGALPEPIITRVNGHLCADWGAVTRWCSQQAENDPEYFPRLEREDEELRHGEYAAQLEREHREIVEYELRRMPHASTQHPSRHARPRERRCRTARRTRVAASSSDDGPGEPPPPPRCGGRVRAEVLELERQRANKLEAVVA